MNVDGFCLIFERELSYVIQPPSLTSSRLCPCQWSVRTALLFNQSSDYPFQHFVDENDEANHTGHYGRISYTLNVSQEPSEGPGITSLLKQKLNWAAVTLHSPPTHLLLPLEDGLWWGKASPCVFRCCTRKSMIRKRCSVTRNTAVSAGCLIGTPCSRVRYDYTQPNEHWSENVWYETHTHSRDSGQSLVITWYCSSQPLVTHMQ